MRERERERGLGLDRGRAGRRHRAGSRGRASSCGSRGRSENGSAASRQRRLAAPRAGRGRAPAARRCRSRTSTPDRSLPRCTVTGPCTVCTISDGAGSGAPPRCRTAVQASASSSATSSAVCGRRSTSARDLVEQRRSRARFASTRRARRCASRPAASAIVRGVVAHAEIAFDGALDARLGQAVLARRRRATASPAATECTSVVAPPMSTTRSVAEAGVAARCRRTAAARLPCTAAGVGISTASKRAARAVDALGVHDAVDEHLADGARAPDRC